jgi:FKBP-type peptidyl-prolyl cis-trans isomerase FklB
MLITSTIWAQNIEKIQLKSNIDTLSYVIGSKIGVDLKPMNIDINPYALARGFMDANKTNKALLIKENEITRILTDFETELNIKLNEERIKKAEINLKEGADFLEKNKSQAGVIVTPTGLQYKIITEGAGKTPNPNDSVTVHYWGKLLDGTVFDNTYQRGEPVTFVLTSVIPGWIEGMQLMKEGGKAELYIPSELGYGERGAGNIIPGNAMLIFQLELLKVIRN